MRRRAPRADSSSDSGHSSAASSSRANGRSLDGEQREDRVRLAGVDDERRAVDATVERAEDADREAGLGGAAT